MCSELFIVVVVLTACVGYMYQCVVIVVSAMRCIDGRRLVRLALVLALCWKHSDVEVVVRGLRRGVVARLARRLDKTLSLPTGSSTQLPRPGRRWGLDIYIHMV